MSTFDQLILDLRIRIVSFECLHLTIRFWICTFDQLVLDLRIRIVSFECLHLTIRFWICTFDQLILRIRLVSFGPAHLAGLICKDIYICMVLYIYIYIYIFIHNITFTFPSCRKKLTSSHHVAKSSLHEYIQTNTHIHTHTHTHVYEKPHLPSYHVERIDFLPPRDECFVVYIYIYIYINIITTSPSCRKN